MSISVTIVSKANRVRKFTQTDELAIKSIFESLRRPGQLFSNRTLIISTENETEIFAPASITRIEIETQDDISGYLPLNSENTISLIPAGAPTPEGEISDTHYAGRIDFFFEGGDTVALWLSGPRPQNSNERLMRVTRLFEMPVMMYTLPSGGIGVLNPGALTRALFATGADQLPAGAWHLNSV